MMMTFVSLLYTSACLRSVVAEDAPVDDLQLHREFMRSRTVNGHVSDPALAVATRHLWYL